jgi:hypothetical protein
VVKKKKKKNSFKNIKKENAMIHIIITGARAGKSKSQKSLEGRSSHLA